MLNRRKKLFEGISKDKPADEMVGGADLHGKTQPKVVKVVKLQSERPVYRFRKPGDGGPAR